MKRQRRNTLLGLIIVAVCLIVARNAVLTADVTAREAVKPASRVRIPNVVHMIWKTRELPDAALDIAVEWARKEPHYRYKITTDAECEELSKEFPTLRPRYANLKMNVMKADICRLLVVYKFGGIYRDLDVQHVKPLREWFDHSLPVVYGHEDEHLCQWFFAAHAGNACIRKVIDHVTEAIANVSLDFNAHPELVIDSTGPGAFTEGMKGCPTPPTLTVADLDDGQGPPPVRRDELEKWLRVVARGAAEAGRLGRHPRPPAERLRQGVPHAPAGRALGPVRPGKRGLEVAVTVEQSSHRFGELLRYYPAEHAVDRNLDSFVMTENESNQWWQLNVTDVQGIRVTCARVWSKRRLHDIEFFRNLTLTLYDSDGRSVFVSAPFGSTDSSVLIRVPEAGRTVPIARMRVARAAGAVLFSEIEIFSDNECRVARRLAPPRDHQSTASPTYEEELIRALRANTYRCNKQRAVSWEPWMEFSLCLDAPLPTPCSVVSVTHPGLAEFRQPRAYQPLLLLPGRCVAVFATTRGGLPAVHHVASHQTVRRVASRPVHDSQRAHRQCKYSGGTFKHGW
jgi:hypothetical protein